MNLIQLGRRYVNMDQVAQVYDLSTRDVAGEVVVGLLRIEFVGGGRLELTEAADSLLPWLDQQSTHLPPPAAP